MSDHIALLDALAWDDEDDQTLLEAVSQGREIYISPGLRRPGLPPHEKGGWKDVVALCGFVLDVDVFCPDRPDAHKAQNLPREGQDDDLALVLGDAPDPSLVVHTGYGMHLWWLFDRPLELPDLAARSRARSAYKNFQAPFIERAKSAGFQLDSTGTINHVFRLPGAKNWK